MTDTQTFNTVKEFKDWYLAHSAQDALSFMPAKGYSAVLEGLRAVTLCRRGQYTAELLIGRPGYAYKLVTEGNDVFLANYQGGHVQALYNGMEIGLEPSSYNEDDMTVNYQESSLSFYGSSAEIHAGQNWAFKFGEHNERGMIMVFSYRDKKYLSCLESIQSLSVQMQSPHISA